MLIGPDFPVSIRGPASRIVYTQYPECYPYEIAVKLLNQVQCKQCFRSILHCAGHFFVDLDGNYYCRFECIPAEIRRRLHYQRRTLFFNPRDAELNTNEPETEDIDLDDA